MEAATTASIATDFSPLTVARRRAWWVMCFGLAVLLAVTAWEYSFPDNHFTPWLLLITCWAALSLCWAAYLLVRSFREKSVGWIRWTDGVVGFAALLALITVFTSAPFEIRFRVSERAMNADAVKIVSDPSLAKRTDRVGSWPATNVHAFRGGMRFLIPGIGWLDRVGFAYSVSGRPPNLGGEDIYYRQSDHWWIWQESW